MVQWTRASLWLLKSLKLVWTIPVPLLQNVSGVLVPFPTPPSMLSAFWFHLPSLCPFLPPVSILLPLVVVFFFFIKFAMTFHLGGLNSEALHFWSWAAGSASAGPTCPGDSQCAIQSLPSPTPPGPLPSPIHQQSSLSSQRDATSTGRLRGPFLPFLGDGSRRSGLARRKGVSETRPGHRVGLPNV